MRAPSTPQPDVAQREISRCWCFLSALADVSKLPELILGARRAEGNLRLYGCQPVWSESLCLTLRVFWLLQRPVKDAKALCPVCNSAAIRNTKGHKRARARSGSDSGVFGGADWPVWKYSLAAVHGWGWGDGTISGMSKRSFSGRIVASRRLNESSEICSVTLVRK